LYSRLRGSLSTSTLTPDLGNANVGSSIIVYFAGNALWVFPVFDFSSFEQSEGVENGSRKIL
jgi:hypothetical protein